MKLFCAYEGYCDGLSGVQVYEDNDLVDSLVKVLADHLSSYVDRTQLKDDELTVDFLLETIKNCNNPDNSSIVLGLIYNNELIYELNKDF
jgi:hypothetical protein